MPDAVLIQQASGDHTRLLDLTCAHHAIYAARHGMKFRCLYGQQQTERHFYWDKILLIRAALEEGCYEWITWLDADAMIVRPEADIRMALGRDRSFGMAFHPNPFHYNAGVIYVRNCEESRRYFARVWECWPVNNPWEDQIAINIALQEQWYPGFRLLAAEWNSTYGVNEVSRPVVAAWHGFGTATDRLNMMRDRLRAVLDV